MEKGNCVSFRKFIINLCGENVSDNTIRYYTNRLKEILGVFGVESDYLIDGKGYTIYDEDESFVKKIVKDEYDSKNMQNIRKEQYSLVDCDYIEEIIKGLTSMLSKVNTDKYILDQQIKKMYIKTKIRVRKKSNGIEKVINSILLELKQSYSDDYEGYDYDNLLVALDILKNDIQLGYRHYQNVQEVRQEEEWQKTFNFIRKINNRCRQENPDYDKKIIETIPWNRGIIYLLNQKEEYKDLNNQIDIIFDKNMFANERKRELNKIRCNIKKLREETENEVRSMKPEELEALIKESSDIRNLLK